MNDKEYPFKIGQRVKVKKEIVCAGGTSTWCNSMDSCKGKYVTIYEIYDTHIMCDINNTNSHQSIWSFDKSYFDLTPTPTPVAPSNGSFKPGDIVHINSLGRCYTTYAKAFNHFGFKNKHENNTYRLSENDRPWTVIKTELYEGCNLVMIESEGIELLINEKGLTLIKSNSSINRNVTYDGDISLLRIVSTNYSIYGKKYIVVYIDDSDKRMDRYKIGDIVECVEDNNLVPQVILLRTMLKTAALMSQLAELPNDYFLSCGVSETFNKIEFKEVVNNLKRIPTEKVTVFKRKLKK